MSVPASAGHCSVENRVPDVVNRHMVRLKVKEGLG
jgi:hypothetical protein